MSKLGAKDTEIKIGVILAGGKSRRMGGADNINVSSRKLIM